MKNKASRITEICDAHVWREGPLLPILNQVQAEFGFIDAEAETAIAHKLNLSRAEVHGVVSFYHDLLPDADPRPEVQICRAEACQARGVDGLMSAARESAGERVKLKTVYCLGLCSQGPAARIGDRLHARLDRLKLKQLIEHACRE